MKKFWAEFKKFIGKGNIIDLAIGVVIGTAFNKIVTSLVNDIIMPLVSLAVGGASVTDWKWVITPAEYDANGAVVVAETALKYGVFIQTLIDFMIIALSLFIVVKVYTYSKNKLGQINDTITAEVKKLKKKKKGQGEVEEVVEEVKVEETPQTPPPPPAPTNDEIMISLLTQIRDSMVKEKDIK